MIKRNIPNLLTCCNLLCGCLALVFIFSGSILTFSMFVAGSLVFDFLDGFAARTLNAASPIGKDLDSLSDMVSFGLVPGAIMYHMFINSVPLTLHKDLLWIQAISFLPFLITIFSALRLAIFNNDTRQTSSFIGVPTPAITIFVVGLALVLEYDRFSLTPTILNSYFLAGLSLVLCFLLVSELELIALKFKNFNWKDNRPQYELIFLSIASVVILGITGIPLVIVLYIILSLINKPANR